MNLKSYLKFVEIQTKAASVLPFLFGTVYMYYRFRVFNITNFILMFVSLFCFDMATTALNNYIDFVTAEKKEGYGYEEHNAMVKYDIKPRTAVLTIILLVSVAIVFGFILFLNTNIVVLFLGMLSFAIGILYTFGPIPISRTPLGEIFAGFTQGFLLPLLAIYIHVCNKELILIGYDAGWLLFNLDIKELFYLLLFLIPSIIGIANIMLANNICDIEDDITNNRKTLPIYIGKEISLKIFAFLYIIAYVSIILIVALKIVPIFYIITLASSVIVCKNLKIFNKTHIKSETFVLSVKNFTIMSLLNILSLIVCIII